MSRDRTLEELLALSPRTLDDRDIEALRGAFALSTVEYPELPRNHAASMLHDLTGRARHGSPICSSYELGQYRRTMLEIAAMAMRLYKGPIQDA